MASKDKIIDKIEKKIDSIEKLHDKESMLCEEVKEQQGNALSRKPTQNIIVTLRKVPVSHFML